MTDEDLDMLWLYVHERWPAFTIPDDSTEAGQVLLEVKRMVWRDALGDLPVESVRAALVAVGGAFVPDLGLVRAAALELTDPMGSAPPMVEAWGEVMAKVGSHGRDRPPEWSHPAVEATVQAVGWREICNSTDLGVIRGQFSRMYEQARQRHASAHQPAPALLPYHPSAIKRLDEVLELEP